MAVKKSQKKKIAPKKSRKSVLKKLKGLTLHFLPFVEIESLGSTERIKKLLKIVLANKVIIIQGKLYPEEETRLIEDTMALVGTLKGFKGIELAVITPDTDKRSLMSKMKHGVAHALVGHSEALTIIGPANVIKEMKKDPKKLEIMMSGK